VPAAEGDDKLTASARSLTKSGEQIKAVFPASGLQPSTLRRLGPLPHLYFSFRTPLRAIVITDRRILVTTRGLYRRTTLRRLLSEHPLSPLNGSFKEGNAIVGSEYRVDGLGRRLYIEEHEVPTLNRLTRPTAP
jgi:hypothetical protein